MTGASARPAAIHPIIAGEHSLLIPAVFADTFVCHDHTETWSETVYFSPWIAGRRLL